MGEVEDEPVLRDALHPGAGVGDDLAHGVQPVVPGPEGPEHAAGSGFLGVVRLGVLGGVCGGVRRFEDRVGLLGSDDGARGLIGLGGARLGGPVRLAGVGALVGGRPGGCLDRSIREPRALGVRRRSGGVRPARRMDGRAGGTDGGAGGGTAAVRAGRYGERGPGAAGPPGARPARRGTVRFIVSIVSRSHYQG
ncbi:hypothetical protein GCM10009527_021890 [Actinomadura nitritigenes]